MQSNVNDPLDLDKRKTHNGIYDAPHPSNSGTWTQLYEEVRAKTQ